MNGAEIILKTAVEAGIEVCFTNPGTTEMPLMCAFDTIQGIKPYLGLFEGCCTGAADGYGRMADKPAMTLLHLGPGFANGIANLHNARRGGTPVLNVIGEHATWHRKVNAPLTMDIESLVQSVSGWQRSCKSVDTLSRDTAEAIAASMKGRIATLIVPSDIQAADCPVDDIFHIEPEIPVVDQRSIKKAADVLRTSQKTALILGGRALRKKGLKAAARIRAKTGCAILSERAPARIEKGLGIPSTAGIPYFPEQSLDFLADYQAAILVGADEPVAFFGWHGYPSHLLPQTTHICSIQADDHSMSKALEVLAETLEAPLEIPDPDSRSNLDGKQRLPEGRLTADKACSILAMLQPEHAIVVNESITSGGAYLSLGKDAPPHTLMALPGGSIGYGIPCAVGAAVACPQRPVINFQADGSAMYTLQALWMQARESLNVTTLICSNRSYQILNIELLRAGITNPGHHLQKMTSLDNPSIGWVKVSQGLGVPAKAVENCEEMTREFTKALAEEGPHLIELRLG